MVSSSITSEAPPLAESSCSEEFPYVCRELEVVCLGEAKNREAKSICLLEKFLQLFELVGSIVLASPGYRGHAIWIEQTNFEGGKRFVRMGAGH